MPHSLDWETLDEDNLDGNSLWDLQAGRGAHVAGMIYAWELRQQCDVRTYSDRSVRNGIDF